MKAFGLQVHGEEAKFAIVAGAALLVTVVLPFTGAWYVDIATVSLSAICAIALALFRVRFWVRLITMPLAMLAAFILVMLACDRWLDGTSTSWGDLDYDARYFGSQLLMKCPMFGRVARTQEGQKAKADYERWGDHIDDLTILPWRSYEKRYRRYRRTSTYRHLGHPLLPRCDIISPSRFIGAFAHHLQTRPVLGAVFYAQVFESA